MYVASMIIYEMHVGVMDHAGDVEKGQNRHEAAETNFRPATIIIWE